MGSQEILAEAIDYFRAALVADADVLSSLALLRGSLYGWPDGSFAKEHVDRVGDFLDSLSFAVEDDNGNFDFRIDARDHKAAIVGREVAPYV